MLVAFFTTDVLLDELDQLGRVVYFFWMLNHVIAAILQFLLDLLTGELNVK